MKSITLPWPAEPLHSNSRCHRAVKAKSTKKARSDAAIMAKSAGVGCWPDAEILIEYYPPSRRGDPQNVPSSLKAYIDGIADAMGCDDRRFRVDYPREFAGTKNGGEVVFRVYPSIRDGEPGEGGSVIVTKLDKLRAAAQSGDWAKAMSIAAKFPRLGEHKADIMGAHEAFTRPDFQRQIGKSIPDLKSAGILALMEKYDV